MFENAEVFEAMMQSQHSLNAQVKGHLLGKLPEQQKGIAAAQLEEIGSFKKEILDEVT